MKNIIIVCDSLRIGGIQRALLNMLEEMDYSKYNVSLFLFNSDENLEKVNRNVTILKGNKILSLANTLPQKAKEKGIRLFIFRKIIALLCKIFGANAIYNLIFKFEKSKKNYDIAISFSNNANNQSVYFGCNKYVLEQIKAKEKISWLHVDYNQMQLQNKVNQKEYQQFDKIVSVSEHVKAVFLENYPLLEPKSYVVYNSINLVEINRLANLFKVAKKEDSLLTLVSVGRLEENKSPLSYINVAKELKKNKIAFQWWVIGEGVQRAEVEKSIKENNLQEEIILFGELHNPYPYIKAADLFVSASHSESFGLAIVEAISLKKPVVARYYPAIEEIMIDKVHGCISHGDDKELAQNVIYAISENIIPAESIIDIDLIKLQLKKVLGDN